MFHRNQSPTVFFVLLALGLLLVPTARDVPLRRPDAPALPRRKRRRFAAANSAPDVTPRARSPPTDA